MPEFRMKIHRHEENGKMFLISDLVLPADMLSNLEFRTGYIRDNLKEKLPYFHYELRYQFSFTYDDFYECMSSKFVHKEGIDSDLYFWIGAFAKDYMKLNLEEFNRIGT